MISVDRNQVQSPESLTAPGSRGLKERDRAIEHYTSDPLPPKSFTFSAYKGGDVKLALDKLFHGKCAYCESVYASIHPMDVEHWRPKGEVTRREGEAIIHVMKPGYYWLAAEWTNLLPSCIDCNRQRKHHEVIPATNTGVVIIDSNVFTATEDALTEDPEENAPESRDQALEMVKRGKKNLFPVKDNRYPESHIDFETNPDIPLLLNPCEDDPSEFLEFVEGGVIRPKQQLDEAGFEHNKAAQSIMVYGLNRSRLVYERQEVLLEIKARIYTIQRLMVAHERLDLRRSNDKKVAAIVEDIIEHEMRHLRRRRMSTQPFSLMTRQIIDRFIVSLEE